MAEGQRFDANERYLVEDREKCRAACGRFNTASFTSAGMEELELYFRQILQNKPNPSNTEKLVGEVGEKVRVEAPFRCDYGYNIRIGSNVTIDSGCVIKDCRSVMIGDGVRIGPGVVICGETAVREPPEFRHFSIGSHIKIGTKVFIGAGAVICPEPGISGNKSGITIGDYAYIAPGTVVTQVRLLVSLSSPMNYKFLTSSRMCRAANAPLWV